MLALAINSSYSLELLSFVLFLGISYWNFCLLWQMTGDKNLTQWHLSTALGQCKTFVSFNSTFQADNPDVTAIIDSTCPNNCSNRGECERGTLLFIYFREVTYMYISPTMLTEFFFKGTCSCEYGYGGSDCSFDVLSPPTISRISDNGLCDKSDEECNDITLYGHYFVENMGTTCYVTRKEVSFCAHYIRAKPNNIMNDIKQNSWLLSYKKSIAL